jgi:hypothetical protein
MNDGDASYQDLDQTGQRRRIHYMLGLQRHRDQLPRNFLDEYDGLVVISRINMTARGETHTVCHSLDLRRKRDICSSSWAISGLITTKIS